MLAARAPQAKIVGQMWTAIVLWTYLFYVMSARGYSSVVEHSTADREVPGSNPGVP